MHIEVLTEDRSGVPVARALIPALLKEAKSDATFSVRPHRGKGYLPKDLSSRPAKFASGLLELLPAKCRAYEKAGGVDVLVVVIDADHDDPSWLYRSLEMTVRQFAPSISFVFGIAVEEMESWLLGDKEAVLAAYPKADQKVIDRYEQDSLVGTWEVLCRAIYKDKAKDIIAEGYPTTGQYKHEWATMIAPHLDPKRNKSESFQRFRQTFLRIVGGRKER